MLAFNPENPIRPRLKPSDLHQFQELDRIADTLNSHDVVEYWKSAPFPLNFMDEYQLAKDFETAVDAGVLGSIAHGLDADAIRESRPIDLETPGFAGWSTDSTKSRPGRCCGCRRACRTTARVARSIGRRSPRSASSSPPGRSCRKPSPHSRATRPSASCSASCRAEGGVRSR
jgi:hypothetical protein